MDKLDKLKAIPILDIAERLGIVTNGKKPIACHLHGEKTPSLYLDYKGTNKFKCFGCDKGGSTIDFILETLNTDIKGVLKWAEEKGFLAGNYHVNSARNHSTNENRGLTDQAKQGKDFSHIYEYFIDLLPFQTKESYLIKERCLSYETLEKNNIKAIDKDYKNILLEKFSEADLIASGLLAVSQKTNQSYFLFWDCDYIFPFYHAEKIIYLQGVFKERAKKYKNLAIDKPFLFLPKQFKDFSSEVFITEGIIDTLSLLTEGLNSVAILDANIQERKLTELEILKPFKNILLGDNDLTGSKAKIKLYTYMLKNFYKVESLDIQSLADKAGIKTKIKDANELLIKTREAVTA